MVKSKVYDNIYNKTGAYELIHFYVCIYIHIYVTYVHVQDYIK